MPIGPYQMIINYLFFQLAICPFGWYFPFHFEMKRIFLKLRLKKGAQKNGANF
jgi:hypothetical protein